MEGSSPWDRLRKLDGEDQALELLGGPVERSAEAAGVEQAGDPVDFSRKVPGRLERGLGRRTCLEEGGTEGRKGKGNWQDRRGVRSTTETGSRQCVSFIRTP